MFSAAAGLACAAFLVGVASYGVYCEDVGICDQGEPVLSIVQAVVALPGVVAVMYAGARVARYAATARPPTGLARAALVAAASGAAWFVAVQDLRVQPLDIYVVGGIVFGTPIYVAVRVRYVLRRRRGLA